MKWAEELRQAAELKNAGQHQKALAIFQRIVQEDNNNKAAWWGIALTSQKVDEQYHALDRVLALDPDNEGAYRLLDKLPISPSIAHFEHVNKALQKKQQHGSEQAVSPSPKPAPSAPVSPDPLHRTIDEFFFPQSTKEPQESPSPYPAADFPDDQSPAASNNNSLSIKTFLSAATAEQQRKNIRARLKQDTRYQTRNARLLASLGILLIGISLFLPFGDFVFFVTRSTWGGTRTEYFDSELTLLQGFGTITDSGLPLSYIGEGYNGTYYVTSHGKSQLTERGLLFAIPLYGIPAVLLLIPFNRFFAIYRRINLLGALGLAAGGILVALNDDFMTAVNAGFFTHLAGLGCWILAGIFGVKKLQANAYPTIE